MSYFFRYFRYSVLSNLLLDQVISKLFVTLTSKTVDEIVWCYHSNETSLAVFSHGIINLVCSSNFGVCL